MSITQSFIDFNETNVALAKRTIRKSWSCLNIVIKSFTQLRKSNLGTVKLFPLPRRLRRTKTWSPQENTHCCFECGGSSYRDVPLALWYYFHRCEVKQAAYVQAVLLLHRMRHNTCSLSKCDGYEYYCICMWIPHCHTHWTESSLVPRLGYTYLRLKDNYMEILNKDDEIERLVR